MATTALDAGIAAIIRDLGTPVEFRRSRRLCGDDTPQVRGAKTSARGRVELRHRNLRSPPHVACFRECDVRPRASIEIDPTRVMRRSAREHRVETVRSFGDDDVHQPGCRSSAYVRDPRVHLRKSGTRAPPAEARASANRRQAARLLDLRGYGQHRRPNARPSCGGRVPAVFTLPR